MSNQEQILLLNKSVLCNPGKIYASQPEKSRYNGKFGGLTIIRIRTTFEVSKQEMAAAQTVAGKLRKIYKSNKGAPEKFIRRADGTWEAILVFKAGVSDTDCATAANEFRRQWGGRLNHPSYTREASVTTGEPKRRPCAPNSPYNNESTRSGGPKHFWMTQ